MLELYPSTYRVQSLLFVAVTYKVPSAPETLLAVPPFILTPPVMDAAVPLKVKFDSPFRFVPLPPVITLLSALLDKVAQPEEPAAP